MQVELTPDSRLDEGRPELKGEAAAAQHLSTDLLARCARNGLSEAELEAVSAHLIECEACRQELAASEALTREKPPTSPVASPLTAFIKFLDPITSISPPHEIQILKWTQTDVQIGSRRMMLPNVLVQLRYRSHHWLAKVTECYAVAGGYEASLQIVRDFPP